MKLRFPCPICERPACVDLPASAATEVHWQCPGCDHRLGLRRPDEELSTCSVCGNAELYKKKDFPHWLGLTILTVACVGFVLLNALYMQWSAWAVLIGSALFDGILYLGVRDAVVCYRCGASYHGVASAPGHKPFELVVGERYRQERLRREELKKE